MIIVDSRRLLKHNVSKGFDAGEGTLKSETVLLTSFAKRKQLSNWVEF